MNLVFDLEARPFEWTIQGLASARRHLASPLADERFPGLTASLREWASRPVPLDRPDPLGTEAFVQGLARRVSHRLTQVLLTDEDRRTVAAALAGNDRARLVIRVRSAGAAWDQAADAALALPWELLAPEASGVYPVREGRLAVIREAVTDLSPEFPESSGPLTLAVTIAAPEDRAGFPYEQESFRLLSALAPLGQRAVFSNLGGLSDLADLVADVRATAIHFRGHGLPGGLLFEDELGFAHEVPVAELRRRLAAVLLDPQRAGTFPGLFFLAAPFTALAAEEPSAAAALHRSSFTQVIGFFGPVGAELNTRLEERFYGALARGDSVLAAAEEARAALAEPVGEAGERVRYPFGWSQLAVYHRGADRPLAQSGQGVGAPPIQRRTIEVSGLPVLEHGFIGRRGIQHEVRRRVDRDGQRLVVIQGLGGLGKTALASQLLVRAFAPEPADQLVLRCREIEETDADPVLELRAQAEEHGRLHSLPFWDERVKDLRERVPDPAAGLAAVLRLVRRERPRLAVYIDNAETLQTGPATDDPAAPGSWRPGLGVWWREMERLADEDACLVMVTTRYAWEGLSSRAHVGLPPMEPADSLRLIDSFPALGDLPLAVRTRLAERVDGHPRTVELLDRLIAQRRGEAREIADVWNDLIVPVLPAQEEKIRADLLLEKLWDKLSEKAREHARALTVLRRPAPQFVIDRMGGARDELIRAGWLTRYREQVIGGSESLWLEQWGLHELVRAFPGREFTGREAEDTHRAAGLAYERWLASSGPLRTDQREAIYHLQEAGETSIAWPVIQDHVLWLRYSARYREAKRLLEESATEGLERDQIAVALLLLVQMHRNLGEHGDAVLGILQHALAMEPSEEIRGVLLHEHGTLLVERGEYAVAEKFLRRSLNMSVEDARDRAATLHELAALLGREGRYEESEDLIRQALPALREAVGESHPDYGSALRSLGDTLEKRGLYRKAEEHLRHALDIFELSLGINHPAYAAVLQTLAFVLGRQNRYQEAEDLLRRALETFESSSGVSHTAYSTTLSALAAVLESQGLPHQAETLIRRSLEALESSLGKTHRDYGAALYALAAALTRQGRHPEAEQLFRQSAQIFETAMGPDHLDVGVSLNALAGVLEKQGRLPEAEDVSRRALAIKKQALGEDHPSLAVSLHALATVLVKRGQPVEAEELFRRSLSIDEKHLGIAHPSFATSLNALALLLEKQGRSKDAAALLLDLQERSPASFQSDHLVSRQSVAILARLLLEEGRASEAEALLSHALSPPALSHEIPRSELAEMMDLLGQALENQERYRNAEEMYRESLAAQEGKPEPDISSLYPTLTRLATVLVYQKKPEEGEPLLERALALARRKENVQGSDVAWLLTFLSQVQHSLGRPQAVSTAKEALRALESDPGLEPSFVQTVQPVLLHIVGTSASAR